MANFGLTEHQQILVKLCQICGERLMKTNDKYENSYICADKRDLLLSAFGLKIHEGDQETCPPKFCHNCYKLASRGGTRICINGCRFISGRETVLSVVHTKNSKNLVGGKNPSLD